MKYNWGRFAFEELFDACGYPLLDDIEKQKYKLCGQRMISKTQRACLSYNGKVLQAIELMKVLGPVNMLIVDYDELVGNKQILLPKIYKFIQLLYKAHYADKLHEHSLDKASRLTSRERNLISQLCIPVYEKIKKSSMLSY